MHRISIEIMETAEEMKSEIIDRLLKLGTIDGKPALKVILRNCIQVNLVDSEFVAIFLDSDGVNMNVSEDYFSSVIMKADPLYTGLVAADPVKFR